jgi:putative ATP-binding cassette transporter
MGNWFKIMTRQKKLSFFTAGYGQVSTVFPVVMVSPAYFAAVMNLGGLMQTAAAFASVQQALSFFVTSYRQLAEWRAVIDRLAGFERAIACGRAFADAPGAIKVEPRPGLPGVEVGAIDIHLPSGGRTALRPPPRPSGSPPCCNGTSRRAASRERLALRPAA